MAVFELKLIHGYRAYKMMLLDEEMSSKFETEFGRGEIRQSMQRYALSLTSLSWLTIKRVLQKENPIATENNDLESDSCLPDEKSFDDQDTSTLGDDAQSVRRLENIHNR